MKKEKSQLSHLSTLPLYHLLTRSARERLAASRGHHSVVALEFLIMIVSSTVTQRGYRNPKRLPYLHGVLSLAGSSLHSVRVGLRSSVRVVSGHHGASSAHRLHVHHGCK